MSVMVTVPRGFEGHGWRPRIVVEELVGALRMIRVNTAAEAMAVHEAWRAHDYRRWPGEVRIFPENS